MNLKQSLTMSALFVSIFVLMAMTGKYAISNTCGQWATRVVPHKIGQPLCAGQIATTVPPKSIPLIYR